MNEVKKKKDKHITFWATLVMQIFILAIVVYSGEIYKAAFIYSQIFLIIMLISHQREYRNGKLWEELYNDSLEEEIKEVE